jgi:hypothetical protein
VWRDLVDHRFGRRAWTTLISTRGRLTAPTHSLDFRVMPIWLVEDALDPAASCSEFG